jgi:hypothetical protein
MDTSKDPAADPAARFLQAERDRCTALVRGDIDRLEGMLADGLAYLHSTGAVDDKPSYLRKLRSGAIAYRKASAAIDRVHVHGDTAVLVGRFDLEARVGDATVTSCNPFVAVWTGGVTGTKLVSWASARPQPAS